MRTPQEIYADIEQTKLRPVAHRIIAEAQKEAYNQAIDDAAATMNNQETLRLPQQTILALKK